MRGQSILIIGAVVSFSAWNVAPIAAQPGYGSVAGTATGTNDGAPIPFAIVRLMPADRPATTLQAVLTDPDGRFTIAGVPAGEYRLQLDRIGYEKVVSPVLRLAPGETLRHDLRGTAAPVQLSAVRVSPGRCLSGAQLGEDSQLDVLWREARKGAEGRRAFELQYRFTRVLTQDVKFDRRFMPDARRHAADTSVSDPDSVAARRRRAQDAHRADGYVRTDSGRFSVSLPDETELLDEEFLRDHCLETAPEKVDRAFALRFRPLQTRQNGYGLRGTIWVEDTFLIRRLEFEYVKGDSALITSSVSYADIPVGDSSVRLRANGTAAGHPDYLPLINWIAGTFTFSYRNFERVAPR